MAGRLADFGLQIPRELGGETAAIVQALRSRPPSEIAADRDGFADTVLAALPPRRASAKRQATAQRQAREARRA